LQPRLEHLISLLLHLLPLPCYCPKPAVAREVVAQTWQPGLDRLVAQTWPEVYELQAASSDGRKEVFLCRQVVLSMERL
jgi:hypothetical protein